MIPLIIDPMSLVDTGLIPSSFSLEMHSFFIQAQNLRPKDMKHLDIFEGEESEQHFCASVVIEKQCTSHLPQQRYFIQI